MNTHVQHTEGCVAFHSKFLEPNFQQRRVSTNYKFKFYHTTVLNLYLKLSHSEDLDNFPLRSTVSQDMPGTWHAWEREETCTGFWWDKPEGKRPLERPRRRWEDGIKMDLREIG
jgi:hypothetical protein